MPATIRTGQQIAPNNEVALIYAALRQLPSLCTIDRYGSATGLAPITSICVKNNRKPEPLLNIATFAGVPIFPITISGKVESNL